MTFVFLFILVLNCLVIFTADALLGTVAPTQTITKVIVLNSTTVPSLPSSLVQNGQLALGQPENNLYAADDSFGGNSNGTERKSKVVGRKGVSEDLGSSSIVGTSESSTTSNRESFYKYILIYRLLHAFVSGAMFILIYYGVFVQLGNSHITSILDVLFFIILITNLIGEILNSALLRIPSLISNSIQVVKCPPNYT